MNSDSESTGIQADEHVGGCTKEITKYRFCMCTVNDKGQKGSCYFRKFLILLFSYEMTVLIITKGPVLTKLSASILVTVKGPASDSNKQQVQKSLMVVLTFCQALVSQATIDRH